MKKEYTRVRELHKQVLLEEELGNGGDWAIEAEANGKKGGMR